MIEIKVNNKRATIRRTGNAFSVNKELIVAMVAALRQIRDIDKGAYKATCAWIKDGHLIREAEEDD